MATRRRRCHRSRRCAHSRRERSCSILRISAGGRCTTLSARPSRASLGPNSPRAVPARARREAHPYQVVEEIAFAQAAQKGPAARRREVRGVLSLYVAAPRERANAADGPFSATCYRILARSRELAKSTPMTMAMRTKSTADAAG